jgi:hypothetical protein
LFICPAQNGDRSLDDSGRSTETSWNLADLMAYRIRIIAQQQAPTLYIGGEHQRRAD